MKKAAKNNENKNTRMEAYSAGEMKHYLGVLNEMHGENLKGIREGFDVLNRKFDRHEKVLASHGEMIGSLIENMEIVKEDLAVIKNDLKRKVDYDDFLSLVRRVQKLESKS